MNNRKFAGLSAISFLFAVAGIVISSLLIKEDVNSTAHTIFEYFPATYGVTPSSTWEGAIVLGIFTTVLQVVAASVAFSGSFPASSRGVALVSLIASLIFDNWTDVVFRSGNLSGDMRVAFATTLAFYTLGSEITQGLSWLVLLSSWRSAVSDFMFGYAKFVAGKNSISAEWSRFKAAAARKESKERFADGQSDHNQQDSRNQSQNQSKNDPYKRNPNKYYSPTEIKEEIRQKIAAQNIKSNKEPYNPFSFLDKGKKN